MAELQRKLDIEEDDIALINRHLNDSQGIYFEHSLHQCACNFGLTLKQGLYEICMTADGAAAMEALRAELAQAKEQARASNAAALKAAEELRAE